MASTKAHHSMSSDIKLNRFELIVCVVWSTFLAVSAIGSYEIWSQGLYKFFVEPKTLSSRLYALFWVGFAGLGLASLRYQRPLIFGSTLLALAFATAWQALDAAPGASALAISVALAGSVAVVTEAIGVIFWEADSLRRTADETRRSITGPES